MAGVLSGPMHAPMPATALPLPLPMELPIALVSDTIVNSFCFRANGQVTATIGTKNGPLAGPLYRYRVLSQDSIEIIRSDAHVERWTGIRVEGALLHVQRDGRSATFTIGRPTP